MVDCRAHMDRIIETITKVIRWIWTAYHWYMLVVTFIAGPVLVMMVLTMLVLWFGFGIRWGW